AGRIRRGGFRHGGRHRGVRCARAPSIASRGLESESAGLPAVRTAAWTTPGETRCLPSASQRVRGDGLRGPGAGVSLGDLLMLAVDVAALSRREKVFHHDAIDVVGLVLQAPCEGSGSGDLDGLTKLVIAVANGKTGARDRQVCAGKREAPLSKDF